MAHARIPFDQARRILHRGCLERPASAYRHFVNHDANVGCGTNVLEETGDRFLAIEAVRVDREDRVGTVIRGRLRKFDSLARRSDTRCGYDHHGAAGTCSGNDVVDSQHFGNGKHIVTAAADRAHERADAAPDQELNVVRNGGFIEGAILPEHRQHRHNGTDNTAGEHGSPGLFGHAFSTIQSLVSGTPRCPRRNGRSSDSPIRRGQSHVRSYSSFSRPAMVE